MKRYTAAFCLSATAIVIASPPVSAQQPWVRLGDFGHPAYLDTTATVHRSPAVAMVRVRFVDYIGAGYDRVETQEVNCQTHQSRVLKGEDAPVDARAMGGVHREPPDSVWRSYVAGSFGARLVGAVCAQLQDASRPRPGA